MIFSPGTKIYVSYSTGIAPSITELLTITEYKNNLLYFKEKSDYYAVECHTASFYGYSYTIAGRVIVTMQRWQIPLAIAAEKIRRLTPAKKVAEEKQPAVKLQLSKISS